MADIRTIYGQFTQTGHVSEVKPSVVEEPQMMRQMTFRPEGLKDDITILVERSMSAGVVLDVRMWVEVRKQGELYFTTSLGYELEKI